MGMQVRTKAKKAASKTCKRHVEKGAKQARGGRNRFDLHCWSLPLTLDTMM